MVLAVPETDARRRPARRRLSRSRSCPTRTRWRVFPRAEKGKTFDQDDLPRLVDEVHAGLRPAKRPRRIGQQAKANEGRRSRRRRPLPQWHPSPRDRRRRRCARQRRRHHRRRRRAPAATIRGDTRGGDFAIAPGGRDALGAERGTMAGSQLLPLRRALVLPRRPETGGGRPAAGVAPRPVRSGRVARARAARMGEALHDGGTGRTALRPMALSAVVNPLRERPGGRATTRAACCCTRAARWSTSGASSMDHAPCRARRAASRSCSATPRAISKHVAPSATGSTSPSRATASSNRT